MKAILLVITVGAVLCGCADVPSTSPEPSLPKGVTLEARFAGKPAMLLEDTDPLKQVLVWNGKEWVLVRTEKK